MINSESKPNKKTRIIKKAHNVIYTTGRELVQEKKRRILEGEKNGTDYTGTDLLTHLCQLFQQTLVCITDRYRLQ